MTKPFIDTDVIIRFLTGDDLQKQAAATTLFEQIEQGILTVVAPDTVIADAVYVFLLNSDLLHYQDAPFRSTGTCLSFSCDIAGWSVC